MESILRTDALLCSINDRLGALLPSDAQAGADIPPIGTQWISELIDITLAENEEDEPPVPAPDRLRAQLEGRFDAL